MKKILSYILITFVVLTNVLAPISVSWGTKNGPQIKQNKAEAADPQIKLQSIIRKSDTIIKVNFDVSWTTSKIGDKSSITVILYNTDGTTVKNKQTIFTKNIDTSISSPVLYQTGSITFNKDLTADSSYFVNTIATQVDAKDPTLIHTYSTGLISTKTLPKGSTDFSYQGSISNFETNNSNLPVCVSGLAKIHVGGCIAQGLYYGLFVPSSYLFALAGTFFDYTFAYSINSSSYKSAFVTQGWGLVRDFVDMFFIFILLYIAFGTILNLNGVKTKEMIINVIIIGLLINFSLFAVKVIIDTSNVLARVFYNSDAINITQVGGLDASTAFKKEFKKDAAVGVLPLSMALVNKVNPQSLITNANKVGEIPNDNKTETTSKGISTGTFIIVTILAAGISLVGFIVFLSVGLIFIVRVVGLWLAMILAPFAFFSYTVPAMQNMEMVGWKKWWPELLKLAFLAPVFIFFLYLILQFLQTGLGVINANSKDGLSFVIAIVIPFAFIMVLLMKAKSIAVKMSGDMGAAVSKAGSAVGGMALGAITGGASLAMRSTIGRKANDIANSKDLREQSKKKGLGGFQAKMRLKAARGISKSSFDARKTQFGKWADKSLGTNMSSGPSFIKPKEGGFKGAQERRVKRKMKNEEETKLPFDAAKRQDDGAKAWKEQYQIDMVEAKKKADSKNIPFDESKFRKSYEAGKETTSKGEQSRSKVHTAEELYKQQLSDKASTIEYGPGYTEARNQAKKYSIASGKEFHEKEWREDTQKATGKFKAKNLSETKTILASELREQGKPEKAPISPLEKYNAETSLAKATKSFNHADRELSKIEADLQKIATTKGLSSIDDVEKSHIKEIINPLKENIIKYDNDITVATAKIENNPEDKLAQNDLLYAKLAKQKEQEKIEGFSELLPGREKYKSIKTNQTKIIEQSNDKLSNR